MRSNPSHFELKSPRNLSQALHLLTTEPTAWNLLSGGTDVMVLFEAGHLKGRKFLSLWGLEELKGIWEEPKFLTLGSLTTYTDVRENSVLQKEFPNLCQAAKETGAISIQNRGTLGGNIANASPAADSPPALLCYEAELELLSSRGARWIPYNQFHLGYKKTLLAADEIISKIRLPRKKEKSFHYYRKVGTRKAQAISKTCLSAVAQMKDGIFKQIALGMGSVAPSPLRCFKTEALLKGQTFSEKLVEQARNQLASEIAPISDIRSTDEYRLKVSQNLLEDFMRQASTHVELDQ